MPSESTSAPGPHTALRTGVVRELVNAVLERRAREAGRASLRVLDTGGGSGSLAVRVAALGHRVTVVDPSPDALFALERRAAEEGTAERVVGVQGDTTDLLRVAGRAAYDVVLCHGVLEHVEEPQAAVQSVAGALLPGGGMLSLLVPGMGGAVFARALAGRFSEARRALHDPAGRWGDADPVPHRFTPDELIGLATGAGLDPGELHGIRVFADLVPGGQLENEPDALAALSSLESEVATLPAFQAVAGQLHLSARVAGTPTTPQ